MCGKFTAMYSWREVHFYSDLLRPFLTAKAACERAAEQPAKDEIVLSTPMRITPVVCLDERGERTVIPMRWGWVDPQAPDPLKKPGMMHARGETADVKPLWKAAFANSRGVVWVDTFNVGEEIEPGRVKQWTCRRADSKPLALGVIWEKWEHPRFGSLHTYVLVSTDSPPSIHSKDDRFPLVMDNESDIALWLGETGAPLQEIKTLVRTYEGDLIFEEERKPQETARPAKQKTVAQPSLF
jgi:putative SOS response-associated peptidase YedK